MIVVGPSVSIASKISPLPVSPLLCVSNSANPDVTKAVKAPTRTTSPMNILTLVVMHLASASGSGGGRGRYARAFFALVICLSSICSGHLSDALFVVGGGGRLGCHA